MERIIINFYLKVNAQNIKTQGLINRGIKGSKTMYHGEGTIEKMEWEGISIELVYYPSWSKTFEEIYGYPLAYLEIKSAGPERAALPIADTGYLSHYLSPVDVEAEGGPIAYVTAWLDFKAQHPNWLSKKEKLRQLDLF